VTLYATFAPVTAISGCAAVRLPWTSPKIAVIMSWRSLRGVDHDAMKERGLRSS